MGTLMMVRRAAAVKGQAPAGEQLAAIAPHGLDNRGCVIILMY